MEKCVIVTGAGRGIGAGIAEKLASEKWNVAICDLKPQEDGDAQCAELEKKYGIKKAELTSKSRVKGVAQARHVTIYLIRTVIEMSLPNIGKLFNRDHSTVISSIDSIEKKIASDAVFEMEINNLMKEIKE